MTFRLPSALQAGVFATESPLHDMAALIRSRTPLIAVETNEEPQVVALVRQLGRQLQLKTFRWTVTEGMMAFDSADQPPQAVLKSQEILTESDIPEVMRAKYDLLGRDSPLSFEYETARFSEIGGMQRLRQWLEMRRTFFREDAPANLDPPRGLLLLGVQGCGKSLAAKAAAGIFGLPLLRLDFGILYSKYYGETERNLRKALDTAEIMAPCVLWVDEIEKVSAVGSEDDGLSRRVLGTLLTWMRLTRSSIPTGCG